MLFAHPFLRRLLDCCAADRLLPLSLRQGRGLAALCTCSATGGAGLLTYSGPLRVSFRIRRPGSNYLGAKKRGAPTGKLDNMLTSA